MTWTPPTEAETVRCNACANEPKGTPPGHVMSGGQHGMVQVCGCCNGGKISSEFGRYGHDLRYDPNPRCQP